MAGRRMFSLDVVDTDRFTEMAVSAQALYFHLGMHGDDDGFVSSPRKITKAVGCNVDDLKLLAAKGFIIPFDSGIIVIRDWNVNNTLRNDRYKPTKYEEEKALLQTDSFGSYRLGSKVEPPWNQTDNQMEPPWNQTDNQTATIWQPTDNQMEPQHNITELNRTKQNGERKADKPPRLRFQAPTEDEVIEFFGSVGSSTQEAKSFFDYYTANGWKVGKNSMKDWQAAGRNWIRRAGEYGGSKSQPQKQTMQDALALVDEATDDLNRGIFPQF